MNKLDSKGRLEKSLYNWIESVEKVEADILELMDNKNISKYKIANHIDQMKTKLATLNNNIKRY